MPDELGRLFSRRMDRRDLLRYTGMGVGVSAALAACKKASDTASQPAGAARPPMEQEPGSLQVFDWSGYGNGDYYPDKERANLWQQYVEETGDTPKFILFENDDAGFTKVAQGTHYDIVHPCAYRFQDYVELGVMQPWDTSEIPNFASLNPTLQKFGQIDGQQYFIVEDWGFIAPMYRADKVTPTEDSWSLLFDDRYEGKISWIDTLEMLSIAGIYQGVPNPWEMTDDELQAATDFLISKKPLVRFLWNQSYELFQAFKRDEVWIGYAWPDAVGYSKDAGLDVEYMQPKEGRITWSCGMGLFADTENYHYAHAYVDSWSSTKAAEFLLAWYYYGHANTQVDLSGVPDDIIKAFSLDDLSILEPPNSISESHIPRRTVYSDYWEQVLAA
ncbi:MAG: extracellular solute-binding protein [Actinomycetota bacterium]|nr:extracellular solute-binding protein [Actinomycetota bacterium]